MNDLQAQLEEVGKEKQELQEKVGSTDIAHGHAHRVKPGVWGGHPETAAHYGGPLYPGRCRAAP